MKINKIKVIEIRQNEEVQISCFENVYDLRNTYLRNTYFINVLHPLFVDSYLSINF